MAAYQYKAVDKTGQPARGSLEAANEVDLELRLRRMGLAEFQKRDDTGQRLIQANGVAYNVYGDPQGKTRPWLMDLVPLVIGADEWAQIERAVAQRVTLLNTILADLYGPQRLLHDRMLPAELLFGNPSFLRPVRGIAPRDGVFLQNYAVDLARAPNGAWWEIGRAHV